MASIFSKCFCEQAQKFCSRIWCYLFNNHLKSVKIVYFKIGPCLLFSKFFLLHSAFLSPFRSLRNYTLNCKLNEWIKNAATATRKNAFTKQYTNSNSNQIEFQDKKKNTHKTWLFVNKTELSNHFHFNFDFLCWSREYFVDMTKKGAKE